MKINKHTQKKSIYITLLTVTLCIGLYTAFAYSQSSWPFESTNSPDSRREDTPDKIKERGSKDEELTESTEKVKPIEKSTSNETSFDAPPSDEKTYVNPPLIDQPAVSDPYPIENERYKISQHNQTNFEVTLYPIVNNPEYSNYKAQLKAYKNEVLDYLRKRHGDTNNLTIIWSPSDAQDL